MKLIALHHRLAGFSSHHVNEAIGLIEESARRGWELDLPISRWAPDAVLERLAPFARRAFSDPTFDLSRTFDERVDELVRQLREHVEPALTADSRVMVTIATQCETCALARWASTLAAEHVPQVFILYLSDRWNRSGARADEPAEIAAAGRELGRLPPAARARFTLFAVTPELAAELSLRMGTGVRAVPAHLNYRGLSEIASARAARPVPDKPTFGFVGGARPEKGAHRWADIVAACRGRAPMRFVVQAHNEGLDPAAFERLRALRASPDVTFIDGTVDRSVWEATLGEIDVTVLPYERVNYRQRNSGIFAESIAAGIPGVVPSGTWLADQIAQGAAAGVIYHGEGPGAVADAIVRCAGELGSHARAAAALATAWRDEQSLAACLDAMEQRSSGLARPAP